MWAVYEHKNVSKNIKKAPREILVRYEAWKRIVELDGPQGLRIFGGFNDKGLTGKWKGFRSSRLGLQWRVIYELRRDRFEVYVLEVNPHKY
jgi:mRNA-degrading endonuclease RelE of RelBE toxin-antitoxin system